jgi:hypothetical protein
MKRLFILLLPVLCLAQTSNYPNALDTDASLFVTADNVQSTLSAAMTTSDATATISSSTGFAANMIATICDVVTTTGKCTTFEHMKIVAVNGNALTLTRGFAGTSARAHSAGRLVSVLIDAAHQQALKSAVIAIQTALGTNLSNVPSVSLPLYQSSTYNYLQVNGSGVTGDLSAAGAHTVTLSICPPGISPNEVAITSITAYATGSVTGATNATPIVITETGHGRSTGDFVVITGVTGNLAANGRWAITKINADSYSLDTSVGSAAYVSGGTVYKEALLTLASSLPISANAFGTIALTSAGGGGPSLNGVWPLKYVDPTHVSIIGAPASGSYSGGYLHFANYGHAYLSGGTGTGEAVAIQGGSCTAGASNGTLRFTTANTHTGSWSIGSASSGIWEAIQSCGTGCEILLPVGNLPLYARLVIGDGDEYANNGVGRSVLTSHGNRIRIVGQGSIGNTSVSPYHGGTQLTYAGTDTQSSSGTGRLGAVEFRGSWNGGMKHLTINTCTGTVCAGAGLLLRNVWWSRFEDLEIVTANPSQGVGLSMEMAQRNVIENVSISAPTASTAVYPLMFGDLGFAWQYGVGGGSRNVFRAVDLYAPPLGYAAVLGSIDNNKFDELFTLGGSGGIFFKVVTGTNPYGASFPQENTFIHSPILATSVPVSGTAGSGTCNWFLPYPTSDGSNLPTIAGVCGLSTNGQIFGRPLGTVAGADITSATTITPVAQHFRITGTTTIQTINLPWTGFEGCLTIIPTGALPFNTAGNIAANLTATANVPVQACYVAGAVNKWYLK